MKKIYTNFFSSVLGFQKFETFLSSTEKIKITLKRSESVTSELEFRQERDNSYTKCHLPRTLDLCFPWSLSMLPRAVSIICIVSSSNGFPTTDCCDVSGRGPWEEDKRLITDGAEVSVRCCVETKCCCRWDSLRKSCDLHVQASNTEDHTQVIHWFLVYPNLAYPNPRLSELPSQKWCNLVSIPPTL